MLISVFVGGVLTGGVSFLLDRQRRAHGVRSPAPPPRPRGCPQHLLYPGLSYGELERQYDCLRLGQTVGHHQHMALPEMLGCHDLRGVAPTVSSDGTLGDRAASCGDAEEPRR